MPRAALRLILIGVLASIASLAAAGSLTIESQPGVEVEWDGTSLGRTAADGVMQIDGIPPGEYVLALSRSGYTSKRLRVLVTEDAATIRGFLESEPPPPRQAPAVTPEPAAAPAQAVPRETTPAPQPMAEGARAESAPAPAEPARDTTPVASPPPALAAPETGETAPPKDAPGAAELDEADGDGLPLGQLLLVLAVTLAGGLAIFVAGRRKAPAVAGQPRPVAEPKIEKTVSVSGDDNRFIENLRARERAMDGSAREAPEIIDVEFIDVQELEGDA